MRAAWSGEGPEGLSCPAAAALAGDGERQEPSCRERGEAGRHPSCQRAGTASAPRGAPAPKRGAESRHIAHRTPQHTGHEAGAMQALLRRHRGGAERGSPNVCMGVYPGLAFPGKPSVWIPTFAREHLFSKIRFSIRKGKECFGSKDSLEGIPVASQAAWCDVAFY